jgi:hypothetical protein
VRFELSAERELERLEQRVSDQGGEAARENGTLLVADPDGQLLAFAGG